MNIPGLLRKIHHAILYHAYVKRRIARRDSVRSLRFDLTVETSVFHPSLYRTSEFFGCYLDMLDLRGTRGIEIGSGSGILSLVAARRGARMVAVDINPAAVACTARNAIANGLEGQISALLGDLFSTLPPAEPLFDFVLCNPPYYAGIPRDDAERAWKGGEGNAFLRRLAAESGARLNPGGFVVLVLSSDADVEEITRLFRRAGYTVSTKDERRFAFETLMIVEARKG